MTSKLLIFLAFLPFSLSSPLSGSELPGLYEVKTLSSNKNARLTSFLELSPNGNGELRWVDIDTVITFNVSWSLEDQKLLSLEIQPPPDMTNITKTYSLHFSLSNETWHAKELGPLIRGKWSLRKIEKPVWQKISSDKEYEIFLNPKATAIILKLPDLEQSDFEKVPNYSDVKYYSRKIYRLFKDEFDFIAFTYNYPRLPSTWSAQGVSFPVFNKIKGLGLPDILAGYNDPFFFGSEGRLKRTIFLAKLSGIKNGPFLHELMHTWGIYFDRFVDSTSVAADGPGHWGMSETLGAMGGFKLGTFRELSNGQYHAEFAWIKPRWLGWNKSRSMNLIAYSDMELYLMGAIPIEEVKPFIYCTEAEWTSHPSLGNFRARKVETIEPQEIVNLYGPRQPSYQDSQKSFRILPVLVSLNQPTDLECLIFEESVEYFSSLTSPDEEPLNFFTASRGKVTISMDHLSEYLKTP